MKKYEPRNQVTTDTTDTEIEPITSEIEEDASLRNKVVPNQCRSVMQSLIELERPKTRRAGFGEDYVSEKFRTEPKNLVAPHGSDFEVLKTKLNAISESTESEEAKETKNTREKNTSTEIVQSSDGTCTEPILKEVKATQTQTETSIIGTQVSIPTANQDVQTHYADLKTCCRCDGPTDNFKKSTNVLELQILPQINIPSGLVVQRIIHFSISQNGHTELFFKSEKSNVLFVEVTPSEDSITANGTIDLSGIEPTDSISLVNIKGLLEEMPKFEDSDSLSKYVATSEDTIHAFFDSNSAEETSNIVDETPTIVIVREQLEEMSKFENSGSLNNYVAPSPDSPIDVIFDRHSSEKPSKQIQMDEGNIKEAEKQFEDVDPRSINIFKKLRNRLRIQDKNDDDHTTSSNDRKRSQSVTKEMILRSYHVFDNIDHHDLGSFGYAPWDKLSDIDESVYKTFINPEGLPSKELSATRLARLRHSGRLSEENEPESEKKQKMETEEQKMRHHEQQKIKCKKQQKIQHHEPKKIESKDQQKIEPEKEQKTQSEIQPNIEHKEQQKIESEEQQKIQHYEQEKIESEIQPKIEHKEQQKIESEEQQKIQHHEQQKMESEIQPNIEHKGQQKIESEIQPNIEHKEQQKIESEEQQKIQHHEQQKIEFKKQQKIEPEQQEIIESEIQPNIEHEEQQKIESEKQQKIESEEQQKREEKPSSPRVYDIGLYKSKETQFQEDPKPFEIEGNSSDSFEKISFSLTVSTDTSSSHITSDEGVEGKEEKKNVLPKHVSQAVLRQLKEKIEQQCTEDPWRSSIYDNLSRECSKNEVTVPDFIGSLVSRSTAKLEKVIPKIRRSVKRTSIYIANKRRMSMANPVIASQTENKKEPEKSANKKEVNDTLTAKTPLEQINVDHFNLQSELKKNISIQDKDDSTDRVSKRKNKLKPSFTSTKDNNSCGSFTGNNKNPTVMNVHLHGDFLPITEVDRFMNALEVSKNGRYKDEENLFCENTYQKYPTHYTLNKNRNSDKVNLLDVSSSDIVTSKSLSRGEVKCKCSVSSGELHKCTGHICEENCKEPQQRRNVSPKKKQKKHASKRKNYFSNWVTYYVKNDQDLNDSSWNSSNK